MYRNYEEYEKALAKMIEEAPPQIRLVKKSREEFLQDNYRDKVEWYLMEEWDTKAFHEIFFGDCYCSDEEESDEISPEEERAEELHSSVHDIIEDGFEINMSINQTAKKVYDYLLKEKAI